MLSLSMVTLVPSLAGSSVAAAAESLPDCLLCSPQRVHHMTIMTPAPRTRRAAQPNPEHARLTLEEFLKLPERKPALEYDDEGYRSGTRPFSGLAVSQKKRKVRSWSSRTNGSMTRSAGRSPEVCSFAWRASPGAGSARDTDGSFTSCAVAAMTVNKRSTAPGATVRTVL